MSLWRRLRRAGDALAQLPWRAIDRYADRASRHAALGRHLYYEVSELRAIVRHLAADRIAELPLQSQTRASFDYQWRELNEGAALLSNPEFRDTVQSLVCRLSDREARWFEGRRVIDAGCGSGRFSWAMASLGADVIAVDQSEAALAHVTEVCTDVSGTITTLQHDLLEPLSLEAADFVWSFGVLHHTGDTYRAFRNLVPLVRPGGRLFLMLYGEPGIDRLAELRQQAEYGRLRRLTRNRTYEETLEIIRNERPADDVHGWFDAVSPWINDTYTFAEIEGWLIDAGFHEIRRTSENVNHHLVAIRDTD